MADVASITVRLNTTTTISAVSKAIKSASDPTVGNSTTSTGIEKRVSHCEDNESEWEDFVGVGPDWCFEAGNGVSWYSQDWTRILP